MEAKGLGQGNTRIGSQGIPRSRRRPQVRPKASQVILKAPGSSSRAKMVKQVMARAKPEHLAKAIEVLPPNHELGMKVPQGGSRCGNCEYLASETTCGNPGFVKWHGSDKLPAPKDSYCCDLYEPR
jgi:hypothetical protein